MSSKLAILITVFIIGGLLLLSCGKIDQSAPAPESEAPAPKGGTLSAGAGWEQKWETTLAEARKEGTVSVYTVWTPDIRTALTKAFKEKYGINVEFSTFGRGPEVSAKVQAEARAGLYLVDVLGPATSPLVLFLKPEGLLRPIEPSLILPEVLDSKAWLGGHLPYLDKDGMALGMIGLLLRSVAYNTELIKEGEITSFKDLLKPQYKGKIILNDPSISGGGVSALAHLAQNLWSEEETKDFLRRLITEQEVVIQRDHRLHVEWLARGKYALGIGPLQDVVAAFTSVGSPIKWASLKEDSQLSASTGVIGLPGKSLHPNAGIVFVNWLLTREGQTVFATSFKAPSMRLDASAGNIDPLLVPAPGVKYYGETEEGREARARWLEIAKRIMQETVK